MSETKRPDIFDKIMHLPLLRIFEPFYKKHKEGLLYLFFGAVTTLVGFLSFWLFDTPLGLNELLANLISWVLAVAVAYITNRIWVFDSKNKSAAAVSKESVLFFVTRIAVMLLDMIFMAFLPALLSFLPYSSLIATVVSSVLCLIINYIASKIYIFTSKEKK